MGNIMATGGIALVIVFLFLTLIVFAIIHSLENKVPSPPKLSSSSYPKLVNAFDDDQTFLQEPLIDPPDVSPVEQQYIGGRYKFVDDLGVPTQKGYWQDGKYYEWETTPLGGDFKYYKPVGGAEWTPCGRPVTGDLKVDYVKKKVDGEVLLPVLSETMSPMISTGPIVNPCKLPVAGTIASNIPFISSVNRGYPIPEIPTPYSKIGILTSEDDDSDEILNLYGRPLGVEFWNYRAEDKNGFVLPLNHRYLEDGDTVNHVVGKDVKGWKVHIYGIDKFIYM